MVTQALPHTHPWGQQGGGRDCPGAHAPGTLHPVPCAAPRTPTASSAGPWALEGTDCVHAPGTPGAATTPLKCRHHHFLISPGLRRASC